jgi:hypothetical protein
MMCDSRCDLKSMIELIHNRVQSWAELSRVRSFIQQNEMKQGIETFYREIDLCSKRFDVRITLLKPDLPKSKAFLALAFMAGNRLRCTWMLLVDKSIKRLSASVIMPNCEK